MFVNNLPDDFEIVSVDSIETAPPQFPTSLALGAMATTIVGPVALLPAIGWWAAKQFK